MGIPESIHQLKQEPRVYKWFVHSAILTISRNLPKYIADLKTTQSNLIAQFDTHVNKWPKIICTTPSGSPFEKDDYLLFNDLADYIESNPIDGHYIHAVDHNPGRAKFLKAEIPIYVASFCIQPLIKSFIYQ